MGPWGNKKKQGEKKGKFPPRVGCSQGVDKLTWKNKNGGKFQNRNKGRGDFFSRDSFKKKGHYGTGGQPNGSALGLPWTVGPQEGSERSLRKASQNKKKRNGLLGFLVVTHS